jgi:hypothetical protein
MRLGRFALGLLLFFGLYLLLTATDIFVHETGHYLAGQLLGLDVTAVDYGVHGRIVAYWTIGGTLFMVKSGLATFGGGLTYFSGLNAVPLGVIVLMTAAGVICSVAVILAACRLIFGRARWRSFWRTFIYVVGLPYFFAVWSSWRDWREIRRLKTDPPAELPVPGVGLIVWLKNLLGMFRRLDPALIFHVVIVCSALNLTPLYRGSDGLFIHGVLFHWAAAAIGGVGALLLFVTPIMSMVVLKIAKIELLMDMRRERDEQRKADAGGGSGDLIAS